MASSIALERLRKIGPVFRSKEASTAGVSWRDLYALRDSGALVELSRGVYQLAEATGTGNLDFVTVCSRVPNGTICLDSALAYWNLTDEIPSQVHLAVPAGARRPTVDFPPTRVHIFHAATFDLGRLKVTEAGGERFWISDRERTVVDAFRLRHKIGEDLAYAALRRYLRDRPKPARLADLAAELRVLGPIMSALQVLQS